MSGSEGASGTGTRSFPALFLWIGVAVVFSVLVHTSLTQSYGLEGWSLVGTVVALGGLTAVYGLMAYGSARLFNGILRWLRSGQDEAVRRATAGYLLLLAGAESAGIRVSLKEEWLLLAPVIIWAGTLAISVILLRFSRKV